MIRGASCWGPCGPPSAADLAPEADASLRRAADPPPGRDLRPGQGPGLAASPLVLLPGAAFVQRLLAHEKDLADAMPDLAHFIRQAWIGLRSWEHEGQRYRVVKPPGP